MGLVFRVWVSNFAGLPSRFGECMVGHAETVSNSIISGVKPLAVFGFVRQIVVWAAHVFVFPVSLCQPLQNLCVGNGYVCGLPFVA